MAPRQDASPANVSHLLAAALRKKSAAVKKRRSPDFRKKALLEATVRRVIEDIRAEQIAIREQKYSMACEESEDFQLTKDDDFQLTKDNPTSTDSLVAPVRSRWDDDEDEEEEKQEMESDEDNIFHIQRDLNTNEVTTNTKIVPTSHTSLSSAIDAADMERRQVERRKGSWKPNAKGDWRWRVEDCESDSEEDILGLGSFFSRVRTYTHKRG